MALAVLCLFGFSSTPASSNPTVQTSWNYYPVDANTAAGARSQMQQRGPNGFWAYTRWYVRWTSACQVSLEITYTMPRHVNPAVMPANLRQQWDRMITALTAHEQQHGAHGINAAQELVQRNCRNGNAIVRKWAEQDRIYDRRTGHGKTEGVRLP